MMKLSKLEWILILTILFFVFVYIGFRKKFGVSLYETILKDVGLTKDLPFPKTVSQFFDLFLFGIGFKKG